MTGNINQARTSLDQLLKQLANKEESLIPDDDVKEIDRPQDSLQPSTPRKRPSTSGNRTPRKRMKRENVTQETENQPSFPAQPTYIQKLFDRSVNFAKFNKDTSLYILARAWMENKPHAVTSESLENSFISDFNQNSDGVHSLPSPVDKDVMPCSVIPEPLFPAKSDTLNLENSQVDAPRATDLLNQHMVRWKQVRKSWKDASHKNQRRYMSSIQIIRRLFNQP